MKEVRFSKHSEEKLQILITHEFPITKQLVIDALRNPDKIEEKEDQKKIAQKSFNQKLVIRVVYQDFAAFILVITLYPGRKNRYEKNNL